MTVSVNTEKMLLSGSRRTYKTEGFIALTRKVMAIDAFISHIADSLFYEGATFARGEYFAAQTEDGRYTFYFCAPDANDARLFGGDIIFYKFVTAETEGGTDRHLLEYLLEKRTFNVRVQPVKESEDKSSFSKIYLVCGGDGNVSFPLLSEAQKKIVCTENANMLVQGIAGSGKTNVCVEKIVYCACRGYRGKVLYSTFSRGLLTETKTKVLAFTKNVEDFISYYESGRVVFTDGNHRRAVENRLGILVDCEDDEGIVNQLKRVAAYLKDKVDYMLIEDIYSRLFPPLPVFGEQEFLSEYISRKNFRLSGALEKIKNIPPELIYKEVYGMICGKYEQFAPARMMSKEQYVKERENSFTRGECETIYSVATDLVAYLADGGYTDNNLMSRAVINKVKEPLYSVGIIDEVQDFTQVNLCLFKKLCIKLFCVGDALQMINPAYFSFGYLKSLLYGDVTGVCELKHNYRSSQVISAVASELGEMNMRRFGTHSFVLKGESVPSPNRSAAVFVESANFAEALCGKEFENLTVIVASRKKKQQLKSVLKKTEVLTVAEAKGLERSAVVLCDVLSDNADKWAYLEGMSVNRKTADENSVFRYYFNLFYVGASRAKQYLFVAESAPPESFDGLFKKCFERASRQRALEYLKDIAGKTELDDEELCGRIEKFCSLGQYDNARNSADRLADEELRREQLIHIEVHERHLKHGNFREAGIEYWRHGYDARAREMFTLSGDTALFPLMDALKQGGGALDVEIVKLYPTVKNNEVAAQLIVDTVKSDLDGVRKTQKLIDATLKGRKL